MPALYRRSKLKMYLQYKKDICNDMIANSEDEEEIKKARIELSIINDIEDICEERSRY